jgi:hypothetical protein
MLNQGHIGENGNLIASNPAATSMIKRLRILRLKESQKKVTQQTCKLLAALHAILP